MRERPIILKAHDVRAILDGRKTQTRRPVKGMALEWLESANFTPAVVADPDNDLCPYGQPADRLWVRERFKPIASGQVKSGYGEVRYGYAYEADGATRWNERTTIIHDLTGQPNKGPMQFRQNPWRSPVTMPYRASRITLEITGVRVERLQDISRDDAMAEGIQDLTSPEHIDFGIPGLVNAQHPCRAFELLWESINGASSWDANPWVWVIEFKRIEGAQA